MSAYIQSYLTDAGKIEKIFGCKNKLFFDKILIKFKYDLDDIDDEYDSKITFEKNAKTVLLDIINGKNSFTDIPFIYVLIYEKLVALFGEQIYCPSDEYSVDYFEALNLNASSFIKIPLLFDIPFVHSIRNKDLEKQKAYFLGMPKPDSVSEKQFQQDQADFAYAFDKAIQERKDLVFTVT